MLPVRQILFPVDFSQPCRDIAPSVIELAHFYNCPITLLHAYELPVAFYGDLGPLDIVIPADIQQAHEAKLRDFAVDHLFCEAHQQIVRQGAPAEVIHQFVQHNGTDLLVMSTSGRGPIRRLILGSVTAKVLHDVSCPVWTAAHAGKGLHWPVRNILCALSLDEESVPVAKAAAAIAKSFGARLTLFHAAGYPHPAIDVDYEHYRKQLLDEATQKLQAIRWDNHIESSVVLIEGSAVMAIEHQAKELNADLVIVGRGHAQGAVSRLWSDLYDIIRESPCPVLSI